MLQKLSAPPCHCPAWAHRQGRGFPGQRHPLQCHSVLWSYPSNPAAPCAAAISVHWASSGLPLLSILSQTHTGLAISGYCHSLGWSQPVSAEYPGELPAIFSPQVGCQWQQYCVGSKIMGKGSDLLSSLATEKQTLFAVFYYSTLQFQTTTWNNFIKCNGHFS